MNDWKSYFDVLGFRYLRAAYSSVLCKFIMTLNPCSYSDPASGILLFLTTSSSPYTFPWRTLLLVRNGEAEGLVGRQ